MIQGDDKSVKKTYSKPTLVKSAISLQQMASKRVFLGTALSTPPAPEE